MQQINNILKDFKYKCNYLPSCILKVLQICSKLLLKMDANTGPSLKTLVVTWSTIKMLGKTILKRDSLQVVKYQRLRLEFQAESIRIWQPGNESQQSTIFLHNCPPYL